jgi:class 3 adenylate cyclase
VLPDDVRGIAVHMTARIMAAAQPSEVITSAVTRALAAGSGVRFIDRESHALEDFDAPVELFAVDRGPAE